MYRYSSFLNVAWSIPLHQVCMFIFWYKNYVSHTKHVFLLAIKGTVSRDFRLLFFHESVSPRPLSIPFGPFRIFSKTAEIFAAQGGKWKKSSIIKVLSEYLREFSRKKNRNVLMGYSGAGRKLIHGLNQKKKISWHCPFITTLQ